MSYFDKCAPRPVICGECGKTNEIVAQSCPGGEREEAICATPKCGNVIERSKGVSYISIKIID